MEDTNIIKNALHYYDNNKDFYEKTTKKIKYYKLKAQKNDHNLIYFYDKNKTELFKSRYETIGVYSEFYKVWTWGWSIPKTNKNNVAISKKIISYALDLSEDDLFLKTELIKKKELF